MNLCHALSLGCLVLTACKGLDMLDFRKAEIVREAELETEPDAEPITDADELMTEQESDEQPVHGTATFFQWGSTGTEGAYSVAVGPQGNVYIAGDTNGRVGTDTPFGGTDILLIKVRPEGSTAWIRQWGTPANDSGLAVAVNSSGYVFVAGSTDGQLDGNPHHGGHDLWISRLSSDGYRLWTRHWGTSGEDAAHALAVTPIGDVVVVGRTTTYPAGSTDGNYDIVLMLYDTLGNQARVETFGGEGDDWAWDVVVDGTGSPYFAGYTTASLDGQPHAGGRDIFVSRVRYGGLESWTRVHGTQGDEEARAVALGGGVYAAGFTDDNLGGLPLLGRNDLVEVEYGPEGQWVDTRQWGTTEHDTIEGLAVDAQGRRYLAGMTKGELGGRPNAGGGDAYLVRLDEHGAWQLVEVWGDDEPQFASDLALDEPRQRVYVIGWTTGNLAEGRPEHHGYDIFMVRYDLL